jgi:hypothetical protein
MVRQHFTPAQANATLPLVSRIVEDVLAVGRVLKEREAGPPTSVELREARVRLRELFEELERIGCSYRDWSFDVGLVDFPSRIEGQQVLLCWRSDEPRVEWYHTPEAGYAGRRPIPPELLEPAD